MRLVPVNLIVLTLLFIPKISTKGNNVCNDYGDYKTMADNPNCYYNPAAELLTVSARIVQTNFPSKFLQNEIITENGYEVEKHQVTTEDGYILGLFRIPKEGGQPVFMLHGVECSSSVFVSLGNRSLG